MNVAGQSAQVFIRSMNEMQVKVDVHGASLDGHVQFAEHWSAAFTDAETFCSVTHVNGVDCIVVIGYSVAHVLFGSRFLHSFEDGALIKKVKLQFKFIQSSNK